MKKLGRRARSIQKRLRPSRRLGNGLMDPPNRCDGGVAAAAYGCHQEKMIPSTGCLLLSRMFTTTNQGDASSCAFMMVASKTRWQLGYVASREDRPRGLRRPLARPWRLRETRHTWPRRGHRRLRLRRRLDLLTSLDPLCRIAEDPDPRAGVRQVEHPQGMFHQYPQLLEDTLQPLTTITEHRGHTTPRASAVPRWTNIRLTPLLRTATTRSRRASTRHNSHSR